MTFDGFLVALTLALTLGVFWSFFVWIFQKVVHIIFTPIDIGLAWWIERHQQRKDNPKTDFFDDEI